MEGLEISVRKKSELDNIIDYRIEAEYFNKKFLKIDECFENCKSIFLNSVANIFNGRAYNSEAFTQKADLFVAKIGDVTNKRETINWEMVPKREFLLNGGKLLNDGDILMSLTGDPPDVGKTHIISTNGLSCTWNQRVARVILKSKKYYISDNVLYAVLSAYPVRTQMERFAKGIRQRNLGNECFKYVRLPLLENNIQKTLDELIIASVKRLNSANEYYYEAENILLAELNLTNWQPENETVSVRKFSTANSNNRFDAEYYQPKYDELVRRLSHFRLDCLNEIVNYEKSFEPGSEMYSENGIPFVRVADLNEYEIQKTSVHLPESIIVTQCMPKPKKGTILLSKDGTLSLAYLVREDMKAVTSGALLHLTIKNSEYLPEYLTLVLNSVVVRLQAERDSNGAIIKHWKPSYIEKTLIPWLPMEKQRVIVNKIQQSFALRKESKRLLETAKKAVEIAIEDGEEKAIKYLEENK